ncbi:MAG: protein jag [Clostridia bacterium]|nr:protein jag [Clostridia bacterium]MBQ9481143.1 protein jag [Clostridia bacterium]
MEEKFYTGKTVEDAVAEGLKDLGITKEEATIEVVDEPTKGFLGLGAKAAKVKVTRNQTDGQRANKFVEGLLEILHMPATTELTEDENGVVINVITTSSSAVIGYRGEVLDSIQCLAGAVANTGKEEYSRVVVDCEGYRGKREDTLKNLAEKLAAKAVRTGRKVSLEPMNPFERRIIHSALTGNTEVKTVSEGKEPNRYISIIPNDMKPGRPIREDRRGHGDRNGRRNNDRNDRKGGYNRERRSNSGFTSLASKSVKKSGFGGTYLGNSLKDGNAENN